MVIAKWKIISSFSSNIHFTGDADNSKLNLDRGLGNS